MMNAQLMPTKTVLIVDDDRWTTRAISQALCRDPDISVLDPVHDGHDAVRVFTEQKPDLVLMDLNMPPGISGVESTALIRAIDRTAKIVLLTTVAPGPGVARALDAGAMAVLNKTVSDSTLRRTVKSVIRGDSPELLAGLVSDIFICGDPLPQAPVPSPRLTDAEHAILELICMGHGYAKIAEIQFISEWTVKTHVKRLREKLCADNLAQLVVRALQFRFVCA